MKPILAAHLFPKLDAMLLELLRSLTAEDWRIFTKDIDRESALPQVKISGDTKLGLHRLHVISIVA